MVGLGFKKSPLHKFAKPISAGPTNPDTKLSNNPFDSDDELDKNSSHRLATKPSSTLLNVPSSSMTELFDDENKADGDKTVMSTGSNYSLTYAQRNRYKTDFRDLGGVDNQSVEELENYAAYKAEESTKTVNNCLKIAEDIRSDATNTLITLHHQGEQIKRTHEEAVNIDYHLSRGEKLLGSLGGLFSRTWKPKRTPPIKGPTTTLRDDPIKSKGNHLEQRQKLGLTSEPVGNPRSQTPTPEPTNALQKVEVEKMKQDDALSDLSNVLGELKGMAIDIGLEIDRHKKALDGVDDDVHVLNERVRYANQRTEHLLRR